MSKKKSIFMLILMVLFIAVMTVVCSCSSSTQNTATDNISVTSSTGQDTDLSSSYYTDNNSVTSSIEQGTDLSSGYYVVLTPKNVDNSDQAVIEQVQTILKNRLDFNGYTQAVFTVQDSNKIRIEIPNFDDNEKILKTISSTGVISFQDYQGNTLMDGRDTVDSAYVGTGEDGSYVVVMNFTEKGVASFSEVTNTVSKYSDDKNILRIFLDDDEISSLIVSKQITSPSAQIEGSFTYEQAKSLASVIDSGSLPIEYEISEQGSITQG